MLCCKRLVVVQSHNVRVAACRHRQHGAAAERRSGRGEEGFPRELLLHVQPKHPVQTGTLPDTVGLILHTQGACLALQYWLPISAPCGAKRPCRYRQHLYGQAKLQNLVMSAMHRCCARGLASSC